MEERWLGTLGPRVSCVSLGCLNLTGAYGPTSEDEALRLLDKAVDLGVTHLDTADIYGMGISEEIIGKFLRTRRPRVTVASKGGIRFMRATGQRYIDNSPTYLTQAIDNSLRRLSVERIDVFYVHRREAGRPIEEIVGALADLKRAGKIGAIGLSEVSPETLRRAHMVDRIAAVESEYSLWTRIPERKMLKTTAELSVSFVAFSPLARGMLTSSPPNPELFGNRDFRKKNPRFSPENYPKNLAAIGHFHQLAGEMGYDPAALAIAWVLAQGRNVVAIPGTRLAEHLEVCVEGASLRLSSDDLEKISAVFPDEFPWGERYAETQRLGIEESA
jgi:aryl-alcohol dehydrogenase-like predicted oxidoreductase